MKQIPLHIFNGICSFTMEFVFSVQKKLSGSHFLCFESISDFSVGINFLPTLYFTPPPFLIPFG